MAPAMPSASRRSRVSSSPPLSARSRSEYSSGMTELRARVTDGRLILDEPTDLPEGTVLDLVVDDEGDDLDDAERASLDAAIARAWEQVQSQPAVPAEDVIADLRRRR